jgi:hypothetical protein
VVLRRFGSRSALSFGDRSAVSFDETLDKGLDVGFDLATWRGRS